MRTEFSKIVLNLLQLALAVLKGTHSIKTRPVTVICTWPFTNATDTAWDVLEGRSFIGGNEYMGSAMAAVVAGCTSAEEDRNIHSVGYGGSPDEEGSTTLDAMVMDGETMEVGAVASMPDIREAAQVAFEVLASTKHTLLVGKYATEFAKSRGFKVQSLDTPESREVWKQWRSNRCQPNYRKEGQWIPDPTKGCGPYRPNYEVDQPRVPEGFRPTYTVDRNQHDTIGLIAIDHYGSMAVGLSTSGAIHKIPGRVGDTPIPGAGGYVDNRVGGAVGTGDGDVMMRFLLSFQTVQRMKEGLSPKKACEESLLTVKQPGTWSGALVALTASGDYGAACVGFGVFHVSVRTADTGNASKVIEIPCIVPR
ncbi:unnamed protein product [Dicrocoelium dendriticum]|nr:unnamed protein product [Dicrocoelium dendriticum]